MTLSLKMKRNFRALTSVPSRLLLFELLQCPVDVESSGCAGEGGSSSSGFGCINTNGNSATRSPPSGPRHSFTFTCNNHQWTSIDNGLHSTQHTKSTDYLFSDKENDCFALSSMSDFVHLKTNSRLNSFELVSRIILILCWRRIIQWIFCAEKQSELLNIGRHNKIIIWNIHHQ